MIALCLVALLAPNLAPRVDAALGVAQVDFDRGDYAQARDALAPVFTAELPDDPVRAVRAHALRLHIALATGEIKAFDAHRTQGRAAVAKAMAAGGLGAHDALRFEFGSEIEGTPAHRAIQAHTGPVPGRAGAKLFADCRALAIERNVLIRCPDFLAELGVAAASRPPHRVQRFAAEHFPKPLYNVPWVAPPTLQLRPFVLLVDGKPLPGLRYVSYQAGLPDMQVAESQGVTVSAVIDAELLVASCLVRLHQGHRRETASETCPHVLAAILARQVPESILIERPKHPPEALAGRVLKVPDGCKLNENPSKIVCPRGRGTLSWASEAQGVELAEDRRAWVHHTLVAVPKWAGTVRGPHPFPCRIEGQPAECRRYTRTYSHGVVHDVLAVAQLREENVFLMCADQAPSEGPPEACAQVFAW